MHLEVQRPMNHPPRRPKVGKSTNLPKVDTPEVSDTGAQTGIISPATLTSIEFDPNNLMKDLTMVGPNFPKIGAATSSIRTPFVPVTQTQEVFNQESRPGMPLGDTEFKTAAMTPVHKGSQTQPDDMKGILDRRLSSTSNITSEAQQQPTLSSATTPGALAAATQ